MHATELPLVVFTILAQMSVGSFVVLGVVQLFARRKADTATVDRLADPALYAIGPVMVAALVASIFHLGSPLNALNVLNNVGSSWLSREILFGCTFAGLGAAFAVCQWFKWFSATLRQVLAGVTAIVGLCLVFVMAKVYMLPTIPAWDSLATPIGFYTTTFLLGSLAVGAAFVIVTALRRRKTAEGAQTDPEIDTLVRATLRGIGIACIVLLGVEFIVLPSYALTLATAGQSATTAAAEVLMTGGGVWFATRLVLLFLGAGILGVFLFRIAAKGADRLLMVTVTAAFALVLVSETLGRVMFYDSLFRIGV
jgi:anaerobic dimethyl sulfoxide reductase subunit C (anchor subunit)